MLDLHNAIGKSNSVVKKIVGSKSFKDMVIDSLIVAGVSFFSVWTGEPTIQQCFIVIKAAGLSFFVQLVYEKGIKKIKK